MRIELGRGLEWAGLRFSRQAAVVGILIVALLLRLRGIAFGLPALLDPDESIFMLLSLKLLRDQTLDPGWFGHPGSTTIYVLAAIEIGVYVFGYCAGWYADPAAFTRAFYANPGLVYLPGRVFILLCGLACVWLTWRLGRALFDERVGLLAAALMAIDPLEIRYSQIIRTDMHVTVFILLATLAAVRFIRRGTMWDLALAGVALGFACATKWPAATVAAGVLGACILRWRDHPGERRRAPVLLAVFGASALAGLFVAAPFIFLDYATMLADVQGEGQRHHLGATGTGPLGNLWWYVAGPMVDALGLPGLVLAFAGVVFAARESRPFRFAILPIAIVFLALLVFQNLVWERWLIPLLPLLVIALAWTCVRSAQWLMRRAGWRRTAGLVALGAAIAVPPLLVGNAQALERDVDTRRLASAWLTAHVPAGSSIAIEYLAFDVLPQPWRFYYPAGDRGCVDVRANLAGKIRVSTISKWRGPRTVVDFGNVAADTIATCRRDFIVSSNWDRYRAERADFPNELQTYDAVTAGARLVATFRPVAGRIGGPVVRVWQLSPRRPAG